MIYLAFFWRKFWQIISLNTIWPKTLISAEREGQADHKLKHYFWIGVFDVFRVFLPWECLSL